MKPVLFVTLCALMAGCLVTASFGDEWARINRSDITTMSDPPTPDQLARLATMSGVVPSDDERVRTIALAREKILSTRDFDVRLRDYLEEKREKWKAKDPYEDYDRSRHDLFESMGKIKDPRVVKFMGELLPDVEWTQDPVELARINADWAALPPNASLSAKQLRKLVKDFPSNEAFGIKMDKDIIPWVKWYEEVKTGKRSFSFVGEETVYRFNRDGSWRVVSAAGEAVPGDELVEKAPEPPRRDLKGRRVPERVEPQGSGLVLWPLAVGVLLVGLGVWFWLRRR